jgi:hypothetical protein
MSGAVTKHNRSELQLHLNAALQRVHELIRAQPESVQAECCDAMVRWALNQFIPASSYYRGVIAYANGDQFGAVILRVANLDDLLNSIEDEIPEPEVVA